MWENKGQNKLFFKWKEKEFWIEMKGIKGKVNLFKMNWEVDLKKLITFSMWFTINTSIVVCKEGSELIMCWVGSVDTIENAWILMRLMIIEVSGLHGARRLALKSPVMIPERWQLPEVWCYLSFSCAIRYSGLLW